ncbi:putative ATPase [Saccharomonospora marina XMU15]|uniref:Putative ATPase n=1 Tax=Saccharomonospora marina XMU15 TaxID=882083 RepID=H5X4X3_9PSEU|nr:AAA family ATPase [Saccharomonospora marina]EHR52252.1 putative ATPase [Saccharomonospora marina XMU15]
MNRRLLELHVENFRSLRKVSLPLRELNVLVGPNGAGKTNVLEVFRFLADVIRTDLEPALSLRGGFDEVVFWGGERTPASIRIKLKATWTTHSSATAPDEYELRIGRRSGRSLARRESFQFKRTQGRGRRITISGSEVNVVGIEKNQSEASEDVFGIRKLSSGLSTLPRLSDDKGGSEVSTVAERLASFRVFDVSVDSARAPARFPKDGREPLDDDAANLAAFLLSLRSRDEGAWDRLVEDAAEVLPQLDTIDFEYPSGPAREVVVVLRERGLRRPTQLADASYGTIRLLGLLALLYDPAPPALTCVEEIDHGLHPQALELLVQRLREASARTQFLIATHSPAMADRLEPHELVVCERRDDGSSVIPAISSQKVTDIVEASEGLPLGELWFSGALGGDL